MKTKITKILPIFISALVAFGIFGFCMSDAGRITADAAAYNGNYYFADFDTAAEAFEAGDELNKEILSEGITLLKNENSLPLAEGAKVSLFGKRSTDIRYGGGGSGSGSGGTKITLRDSLERAGLQVNDVLWDFYDDDSQSGTAGGALYTYRVAAGPNGGLNETSTSRLASCESSYSEYDDAAIVLISRMGNEAGDLPKGMSTGYSGAICSSTPTRRHCSNTWATDFQT